MRGRHTDPRWDALTYAQACVGRCERSADIVSMPPLHRLAAALDGLSPAQGVVPRLWHWLLFQQWAAQSDLAADGHPRRGDFLPLLPEYSRRVWAGGRVDFCDELRVGDAIMRTSTIVGVNRKQGSSGSFVLVTIRHEIAGPRGLAVVEEQDLVYRTRASVATTIEPAPPPPPAALTRQLEIDSVLLFRFSALTGNAHRIHYDLLYARDEEGYPERVVHSPLQAILLYDLLLRHDAKARAGRFVFRSLRPAYACNSLSLEAWRVETGWRLQARDPSGAICMVAQAQP